MRSSRGTLAFIAVGILAAAVGIACYEGEVFKRLELNTIDTRFSIRGSEPPSEKVAVVAIDDATFSDLGLQWPFPRSLHGAVVERLKRAGAKAIAYDVQFTEPTTPRQDNVLIRAVDRANNVVLATEEVNGRGETHIFGGEELLREIGARPGFTRVVPDADGALRHFPYEVHGVRGFAVAAAEVATGGKIGDGGFEAGEAWIDYDGPPGTIPTYSFSEVLSGNIEPRQFEGKVVIVGASSPSLQDVWQTAAGGGLMPGAEVQANAIATVLDGLPLHPSPPWVDIALIVLLSAVAPLAGFFLRPLVALAVAVVVGALYLAAAQLAFNGGLILPVVYPLLGGGLALGAVGTLGVHYMRAAFERQRVRFTFSRFVPEEVVDEVLAEGEGRLQLGGVRRECTVLFSDIRGFTSYSESREPSEVVEVLNHYLSEMTDAIMDHGGTLVAYMGDGIMAVFGAPIAQPDHADRAIAAAREMLDVRLPAFCEWMRDTGHGDGFKIGIGLNSGEVMSGQVGSERRMEYTTIGDTTNTASRLEGMTKGSGHYVFVSDTTRAALTNGAPELVPVGDFEIRGRERPLKVWSLPDGADGG